MQRELASVLDTAEGPLTLISMCAGQGRDVIPVLAAREGGSQVRALLVELDSDNARSAQAAIAAAGLNDIEVRCTDAAMTDSYADYAPADIILACGIFGNITVEDIEHTVVHLSSLATPSATVLWTRGFFDAEDTMPSRIRSWFEREGFDEVAFEAPDDWRYSVGVHRLNKAPQPFVAGLRLFTFVR